MVNFDDKRNFYRMLLNSEVIVTIIDDEANSQIIATCRDLSATGLAIEMTYPLETGTQIKAKINSANASIQSLEVHGKVVRVVEEASDIYIIAVEIEEID